MNDFHQLVSDTLFYLKDRGFACEKKSPVQSKKTPPLNSEPSAPMLDKIKKHLPHLALKTSQVKKQKVAIICDHDRDLSFLQNLAKAIENKFCPAVILKTEENIESYTLILTQHDLCRPHQIILAPISIYQNNLEEKKRLWSKICQILSQKSS